MSDISNAEALIEALYDITNELRGIRTALFKLADMKMEKED